MASALRCNETALRQNNLLFHVRRGSAASALLYLEASETMYFVVVVFFSRLGIMLERVTEAPKTSYFGYVQNRVRMYIMPVYCVYSMYLLFVLYVGIICIRCRYYMYSM